VPQATLGMVLRRRRRQLGLTQLDVGGKANVGANYIGYMERDLRRPGAAVLAKLAKVLDLDREELFFLAHPDARDFIQAETPHPQQSAWESFRANRRLHTRHGISPAELKTLQAVAALGPVRATRDFLFILQAIRQALQDE
jgi:transcriptional regulator with XRE-family HTH domain